MFARERSSHSLHWMTRTHVCDREKKCNRWVFALCICCFLSALSLCVVLSVCSCACACVSCMREMALHTVRVTSAIAGFLCCCTHAPFLTSRCFLLSLILTLLITPPKHTHTPCRVFLLGTLVVAGHADPPNNVDINVQVRDTQQTYTHTHTHACRHLHACKHAQTCAYML